MRCLAPRGPTIHAQMCGGWPCEAGPHTCEDEVVGHARPDLAGANVQWLAPQGRTTHVRRCGGWPPKAGPLTCEDAVVGTARPEHSRAKMRWLAPQGRTTHTQKTSTFRPQAACVADPSLLARGGTLPEPLVSISAHVRALGFADAPDYDYLRACVLRLGGVGGGGAWEESCSGAAPAVG
eukprot:352675-Chlamydomonas_euryale.AAC.4